MTLVEFHEDLWQQKTRVHVLSCGVVYVILCLAVLVELRLVTDRQTDGRSDGQTQGHGYYRGCIASRGKNCSVAKLCNLMIAAGLIVTSCCGTNSQRPHPSCCRITASARQSLYILYNWPGDVSPQNGFLSEEIRAPTSTWFPGPHVSTPQTASRSVQPFYYGFRSCRTDKHTSTKH